jgi:hypothetical protein
MQKLIAGFAQSPFTPASSDVFMDGYGFRVTPAEGVRDDLYVKVCAVESGGEKFAIISLDVCGMREDIYDIVTGHITAISGLPRDKMAVCATHTHASVACGLLADLPVNFMLWHHIGVLAGQTVKTAFENAAEGHFIPLPGDDLRSANNRRNGGSLCDRRVKVIGFYKAGGDPAGFIVSASCHPVIRKDMLLSADYPGVLTRDAAQKFPGVPFVFLQGRAADVNPSDMNGVSPDAACERLGGELRDNVFGAIANARDVRVCGSNTRDAQERGARVYGVRFAGGDTVYGTGNNDAFGATVGSADVCALRNGYFRIDVPMKDYPDAGELEKSVLSLRENLYAARTNRERREPLRKLVWNENALKRVMAGNKRNALNVPVQILAISGEIVFIFIPFELLTGTGDTVEAMLTRLGYSAESAMVIGYSNGTYGYLAPKDEIPAGGYEIDEAFYWYGLPQCCENSEGAVLDGVRGLIKAVCE